MAETAGDDHLSWAGYLEVRRSMEMVDERTAWANVSSLGAPALPDLVAEFKRRTAQELAQGFCQRVAQNVPGYRVAVEALKLYIRQEITGPQLAVAMNVHLQLFPTVWHVTVRDVHGQDHWTIDYGGAIDGWRELVFLMEAHLSLRRFRLCPGCAVHLC